MTQTLKPYFDEWYGWITRGVRIAIKRGNLSISEWEALLMQHGLMGLYDEPVEDEDYRDIIAFILLGIEEGRYR